MLGRTASAALSTLLDRDPREWRTALEARYRVLDEVRAGERRALIYPAGRMGRHAARRLSEMGVEVVGFGDRDPQLQRTLVDGLPVLGPDEIAERHASDVILVASTLHDSSICVDLRSRGCQAVIPVAYLNLRLPEIFKARELEGAWKAAADPANRGAIEAADALFADEESRRVFVGKLAFYLGQDKENLEAIRAPGTIYFDTSVYQLSNHEAVVDGGAFVGDTLASFLEVTSGRFRSYLAFEPDEANFPRLAAMAAVDPARITAVRAGLARKSSTGRLLSLQGFDSRLLGADEAGGESVPVVSLDEYLEGRGVPSLIKLDIEGAEEEALLGASAVIRDAQPVLAISAYHFPTDLWTIPLLLSRLMPSSRLYLRHHTREFDDTVCYAVPTHRRFAAVDVP